jgi:hypothetical protein
MKSNSHGELWAITSYFNPMHYERRLLNYRIFRSRLKVPLLAIELAYDSNFELQHEDAEILIRLRGNAVLWQKERLLNVALRSLPDDCRKVAWVDCDVIFGTDYWIRSAIDLLDRFSLVQIFKNAHYLSAQWTPAKNLVDTDVEITRPSAAFSILSGTPAVQSIGHELDERIGTAAPGFAWAARRELLDQYGFFDACIVGGGDRALACAANNCPEVLVKRHFMNKSQQDRYMSWADPFYRAVRGQIGYVDVDLFHLWHGGVHDRRTRARHEGLQRFNFDPAVDIAIDTGGCWRWASDKPGMHDYVRSYFSSRREDG